MSSHATPATVIFFFFPRHCRTTSAGHRSDLAPAKLLCPSLYSAPLPSLDLNQHCCRLCPSADSRVRLCPRTDLPISGYSGAGSAKFFLCSSRKKRVDWGSNLAPVRAIVVDHRQTIRIWPFISSFMDASSGSGSSPSTTQPHTDTVSPSKTSIIHEKVVDIGGKRKKNSGFLAHSKTHGNNDIDGHVKKCKKNPHNAVKSGAGFVEMMKEAQPRFKIPNRKKIASLVWDLYALEVAKIKSGIGDQRVDGSEKKNKVGPPMEKDWEKAQVFVNFLKRFHDTTLQLSATKKTTSSLIWEEIVAMRMIIDEAILDTTDPSLQEVAKRMESKFKKYWGNLEKVNKLIFLGNSPLDHINGIDDGDVDKDLMEMYKNDPIKLNYHLKMAQLRKAQKQAKITNEVDKYFSDPFVTWSSSFDILECLWIKPIQVLTFEAISLYLLFLVKCRLTSCEVQADFMIMSFSDDTFDAVYAIEATCHAPDVVGCYKEIYQVLKPGQYFAAYEWCMTDHYNPSNGSHKKAKAEIELGNGLPDVRTTRQCLDALKLVGFEVIWEKDHASDSPVPWYLPLDTSRFLITSFRLTAFGRFFTRIMVKALEFVRIAPAGSNRISSFLKKAAEGLVVAGRMEIFTPMYFFLVRRPLSYH
ncbi:hypothetical protein ZIOFF_028762 [Zingiber officinale]|uniref:Methyltransferase n=1 Tax=Zingiber officinale TaxID=94328 RepID=A0A8J5GSJ9_ZINOF|nr:hypothetical protein ZIOFF_028762 [Zingiber officinale]